MFTYQLVHGSSLNIFFYFFQIVTDAPWELSDEFLSDNKIDFVAHDEIPYTSNNTEDIYAKVKERGMFVATERTEGKQNHMTLKSRILSTKYLN